MGGIKSLFKLVKKSAPLVANVLTGSAGGTVIDMLGSVFDTKDGGEEALEKAIASDPQAAVKLRQFEIENKTELQRLALKEVELQLADRQSARTREMEVVKATGQKDWFLYLLASTLFFGFFALIAVLIWKPLPQDTTGVLFMLFGTVSTGFGAVVQYFFGSSQGSKQKTTHLVNGMNGMNGKKPE